MAKIVKYLVILLIVVVLSILAIYFMSAENRNKLSRTAVSVLDGNYRIVYTDDNFRKDWECEDCKVTSEGTKGYYYFWYKNEEGKRTYVQTPINRTYIEEVP